MTSYVHIDPAIKAIVDARNRFSEAETELERLRNEISSWQMTRDIARSDLLLAEGNYRELMYSLVDERENPRKTPAEWCEELHITIVDPDGWRGPDDPDYDTPITREDFLDRSHRSTTRIDKETK